MKVYSVGVLGHVDSGKTTLSKSLSMIGGTCAFDKHPESQRRGITLDLGFSSVSFKGMDICLVDCPGHASLIRTVIGASQIIHAVLLVIDANQGIQTQTSECIVLAQSLRIPVVVFVNKMDAVVDASKTQRLINSITKLGIGQKVISGSALNLQDQTKEEILSSLADLASLTQKSKSSSSSKSDPFVLVFDHFFRVKGKGNVVAGTVLQGSIAIGDSLWIAGIPGESFVCKGIQAFKKDVPSATVGDRVGILVKPSSGANEESVAKLERGYASSDARFFTPTKRVFLPRLHMIKYFKHSLESRKKIHVVLGHETAMGVLMLLDSENMFVPEIPAVGKGGGVVSDDKFFSAVIDLETEVFVSSGMKCLGAKLDISQTNECRFAFWGDATAVPENLGIFKQKSRKATVDRIVDDRNVIAKGLVSESKKENTKRRPVNLDFFIGKKIRFGDLNGKIDGSFGSSGKFRVSFEESLEGKGLQKGSELLVEFKVNMMDKSRKWLQE